MEKLTEALEFFDFKNEKSLWLIHVLCNLGFSYFFYIHWFSGEISLPVSINLEVVFRYFKDFQFVIPIILYFITWQIFSIALPRLLRIFVRFLIFENWYQRKFHKNLIESLEKGDLSFVNELLNYLNKISNRLGRDNYTLNDLEEKIKIQNEDDEPYSNFDFNIALITILLQLFILYVIQTNPSFQSKWIGFFLLFIIIFVASRCLFSLFFQRVIDVIRAFVKKTK